MLIKKCALVLLMSMYFLSLTASESSSVPPYSIPPDLVGEFTLNGSIPVIYCYRNDSYSDDSPIVFTKETIDSLVDYAKREGTLYYGATDTYLYRAMEAHRGEISGKSVAVLGSVTPWYESIVLAYNGLPTTIEYNKIVCEDPRVSVFTVHEYEANPIQFDVLLSVSSFEHDGLGRYGDPINPNGDLLAMKKAKKMLKPGGILLLAVPVARDCLTWNLHRIYGPIRLKALLEGWEIVDSFGFSYTDFERALGEHQHQPVFVLKPSLREE